jgi:hypothetical protein
LIASVQPHMLITLRVTLPSSRYPTVSSRLCWSFVMGELWMTSISRWKHRLRPSILFKALKREL